MISLKPFVWIMEGSAAYRYLQMPFAEAKLRPLFRHNDLSGVRRVLDIGWWAWNERGTLQRPSDSTSTPFTSTTRSAASETVF